MLEINCSEEASIIFLNHRQLINESYSLNLTESTRNYKLKAELFAYNPKATLDESKRKRKNSRKRPNTNKQTSNDVIIYLARLRAEISFPPAADSTQGLKRYWESSYDLPQLNGGNNMQRFQEIQLQPDGPTYLIPSNCRFYNYDVTRLTQLLPELPLFDIVIMDPPWRNKYIRRLKRCKLELGYPMLTDEQLAELPIKQLLHNGSLLAVWCTNSLQHQQALLQKFLPCWNLQLLHTLKWCKLNTNGDLICPSNDAESTHKQPYEMLYIACSPDFVQFAGKSLRHVKMLFSIPSIVHSHKPPLFLWLRKFLRCSDKGSEPKCLEIFARYLQPGVTSVGLEVLKLMDKQLYDQEN